MKPILSLTLLLACLSTAGAQNNSVTSSSSSSSQSVTVTSDGKSTVKKTVTTRDGVTTTVTEVTDDKGNVVTTTTGDPGKPAAKQADGAWIGLRTKEASPELRDQLGLADNEGVVADLVAPGGPAAKAGLQPRDLILSVNGAAVGTPEAFRGSVQAKKTGDTVEVAFLRKGQRQSTQVTLEKPAAGAPADDDPNPAARILDQLNRSGVLPKLPQADLKIDGAGGIEAIDNLLKDPNVPDAFKEQLREMRKRLNL